MFQLKKREFLSGLWLLVMITLSACSDSGSREVSLIQKKWVQYETAINGQVLMGEDNPQNMVCNFLKEGKCEIVLAESPQSGSFEIEENLLTIEAGPARESFTIDKLTEKELYLIDKNGVLLKFKPLQ